MNVFRVLLNPEQEERELGERGVVCDAANVLQIGEFQVLQLAYAEWFGRDLPDAMVGALFTRYMLNGDVPPWARHFARAILARDQQRTLDADDPRWHRFDNDYAGTLPPGLRPFCLAVGVVALILAVAVLAASRATPQVTSRLPPFFDARELPAPPLAPLPPPGR